MTLSSPGTHKKLPGTLYDEQSVNACKVDGLTGHGSGSVNETML